MELLTLYVEKFLMIFVYLEVHHAHGDIENVWSGNIR